MGMFDTVVWDCPECRTTGSIREQTKGMPDPQMREFPSHSVPLQATRGVGQYVTCEACERQYLTLALVPWHTPDDATFTIPMPLLYLVRARNGVAMQVETHMQPGNYPPDWKPPVPFYTEPIDRKIVWPERHIGPTET